MTAGAGVPASITDPPSIAVLPFANLSADKENEYFSDGLAEEILNLRARIPGLKVIARTSSFAFRSKDMDIPRIAETLHVRHVLEGSVRKAANRPAADEAPMRSPGQSRPGSQTRRSCRGRNARTRSARHPRPTRAAR